MHMLQANIYTCKHALYVCRHMYICVYMGMNGSNVYVYANAYSVFDDFLLVYLLFYSLSFCFSDFLVACIFSVSVL